VKLTHPSNVHLPLLESMADTCLVIMAKVCSSCFCCVFSFHCLFHLCLHVYCFRLLFLCISCLFCLLDLCFHLCFHLCLHHLFACLFVCFVCFHLLCCLSVTRASGLCRSCECCFPRSSLRNSRRSSFLRGRQNALLFRAARNPLRFSHQLFPLFQAQRSVRILFL
jgi:hypothetical protein